MEPDRFTCKFDPDFNKRTPELELMAELWAEEALKDPKTLDFYIEVGEVFGCSPFEAAVNDYCTAPIILGIFYHNDPQPRVVVRAVDDVVINSVFVVVHGKNNYNFEGYASYNESWGYFELPIPNPQYPMHIAALVMDWPGNQNHLYISIGEDGKEVKEED
jgi:hypothetical protein